MTLQLTSCIAALALALTACGPKPQGDDDDGNDGEDAPIGNHDGGGGGPDADDFDECQALRATVRDFSPTTHSDFEPWTDSDFAYPGLVQPMLGGDDKPVYAHAGSTPHTAGPAEFLQWYRDEAGTNMTFETTIPLTESGPGRFAFHSDAFFPLDGRGFGNEGRAHNFHFTTEIHTVFRYRGGETFTFTGDDDLWLFINKRLAIDLGGMHPSLSATVNLDASASMLGITPGQSYRMDIFHAERHTDASNFHVETTIDCFVIP